MSNPSTPFGFEDIPLLDGGASTFGLYTGQILTTNQHSIYRGDVATFASGYFDYAAAVGGGATIYGIFESFSWLSISAGMRVYQRAWLGAIGDLVSGSAITCKVKMHPHQRFRVRANGSGGSPIGQADIGKNINFARTATPGGNLVSGYTVDQADFGAGASLPFKVTDIEQAPTSDPASIYNIVIVGFNNLVTGL